MTGRNGTRRTKGGSKLIRIDLDKFLPKYGIKDNEEKENIIERLIRIKADVKTFKNSVKALDTYPNISNRGNIVEEVLRDMEIKFKAVKSRSNSRTRKSK